MKTTSVLAGGAVAAAVLVGGSTAAVAAPQPIDFPPLDQATIVDPDTVIWTNSGQLLITDGSLLCTTNPESIAFPSGTRPCYTGLVGIPGGPYPLITLTPFEEATVIDPSGVTIVEGGVITADGTDLCAANPGSIVFPDGSYPCYINFDPDQAYGMLPTPEEGLYDTPQVTQLPVGGADTGVQGVSSGNATNGVVLGAGILGLGVLAAATALGPQVRRRR